MDEKIRIQKVLANSAKVSRRAAEELIKEKKIKVNGKMAVLGQKVNPAKDFITLNGEKIGTEEPKHYIILHKPRGFISTMKDEKSRKCVAELVKEIPARVFPIGRLDKDSEGLLLMTNDGEFANLIAHPNLHIAKKYRVTVRPKITEEKLNKLCAGIEIEGKRTLPANIKVLLEKENRSVLEFTLVEGRNRQIRKMCESVGLEVARLKRISIEGLKLGMLQPGKWKNLTLQEVQGLRNAALSRKTNEKVAKT